MTPSGPQTFDSCAQVLPKLDRFWREELAPAEAERVQAHLESCDRCADALAGRMAPNMMLSSADPEPLATQVRPPWAAFRGFLAARQGRIGPRASLLKSLAAQGDPWAEQSYDEIRAVLEQTRSVWKRRQTPSSESTISVLARDSWMPTGEWAALTLVQRPVIDKLGKIVLIAQTRETGYLGATLICTIRPRPGCIISIAGTVVETAAGLWEARVEEPMLGPAEEEVLIPPDAVQLYLLPAARESLEEILTTVVLKALAASVLRVRGAVRTRGTSKAVRRPEGHDAWDLVTAERGNDIPLPPVLARQCYGTAHQKVMFRLHRQLMPGGARQARPQLEVRPAPSKATLRFRLCFPNGEERDLTIPPHETRSQEGEPVSAAAFGAGEWSLQLHLLNPAASKPASRCSP